MDLFGTRNSRKGAGGLGRSRRKINGSRIDTKGTKFMKEGVTSFQGDRCPSLPNAKFLDSIHTNCPFVTQCHNSPRNNRYSACLYC